jgi:hypothetical protein
LLGIWELLAAEDAQDGARMRRGRVTRRST